MAFQGEEAACLRVFACVCCVCDMEPCLLESLEGGCLFVVLNRVCWHLWEACAWCLGRNQAPLPH